MIWTGILVGIGAFFGAISRFLISRYFSDRLPTSFPIGTFIVNLLGSLLLGIILGSQRISINGALIFGTGFMGSLTTFSTFTLEAFQLLKNNKLLTFFVYFNGSYIIGFFFSLFGYYLGTFLYSIGILP